MQFDWLRYIQLMFAHVNITIDESEQIVVYAPGYLEKIVKVLQKTSNRWDIVLHKIIQYLNEFLCG